MRNRRATLGAGVLVAALLATGGAAGAPTTIGHAKKAQVVLVSTRKLKGLGQVLVDARGQTLYMFVPDKRRKVTCTGSCAAAWPPLELPKGAKLAARGKAKRSLLGSDPNPDGGRVVTYARWPLYTYVADTKPGEAFGQALDVNGGLWYVLSPAGKVIRKKP
jgi:predicted lipoprotein with Yx(FWY)xxD motif